MTKTLVCVTPDQNLAEAEELLVEHRIGGAPVVEDGRLVGILGRGDVARVQVLMNSLDGQVTDELRWGDQADGFQHSEPAEFRGFRRMIDRLKVKDAMHDQPATCAPDASVERVAESMIRHHVHHVIVVEGARPLGIVSSLDLLKLLFPSETGSAKG